MKYTNNYLAIDLGAESGRAIIGMFNDRELNFMEVHRFKNGGVRLNKSLHWDVLRLWSEIKTGLAAGVSQPCGILRGVGIDTWGVDFALLDHSGTLLSNPFHYRDTRTNGIFESAFQCMPKEKIFQHTGIQFMQINSLYQLYSMVLDNSSVLEAAGNFLTIPDLFNYWLTGEMACEFTNATTTQCFDPLKMDWAWPVLDALSIPKHLFGTIIQPGTILGSVLPFLADEIGVKLPVIAPACHDTGSAVVAVPSEVQNYAWISSGTWSIMGVEVNTPRLDEKALHNNFTNEGGVFNTWRLSKNIMGLWLIQECKSAWAERGEKFTYDELTHLASTAKPFVSIIDPDDRSFLYHGNMPENILAYCQRTGQYVPQTKGEILRIALEGIALKYRFVLDRLEEHTGVRYEQINIIGGGSKNRLLNQFTADATGRTVLAGPDEATAIGNILMQAIAMGDLGSLEDARSLVRRSFAPEAFYPAASSAWDDTYSKLLDLLKVKNA
jgi:rhamnulokinase